MARAPTPSQPLKGQRLTSISEDRQIDPLPSLPTNSEWKQLHPLWRVGAEPRIARRRVIYTRHGGGGGINGDVTRERGVVGIAVGVGRGSGWWGGRGGVEGDLLERAGCGGGEGEASVSAAMAGVSGGGERGCIKGVWRGMEEVRVGRTYRRANGFNMAGYLGRAGRYRYRSQCRDGEKRSMLGSRVVFCFSFGVDV